MGDEQKALETLEAVNTNPTMLSLQLDQIEIDEDFNARKVIDADIIAEMVKSIRERGLINPLVVSAGEKGKYKLVSGFTRYSALKIIDKESRKVLGKDNPVLVACRLMAFSQDIDSHVTNLVENILRKDLTTYEIAAKLKFLSDNFGHTGAQLARLMTVGDKSVGGGKNNVNNLLRAVTNLHPTILEAWREGHNAATTARLFKLAAKDTEEQLLAWNEIVNPAPPEEDAEEDAEEDDKPAKKKGKKELTTASRPRTPVLEAAIDAIRASDATDEAKKLGVAALKFAAGLAPRIPGIYNPNEVVRNPNGGAPAAKAKKKAAAARAEA